MADWVSIPDTAVDPDAPVTSELAYAWRDNVIAVTEGALGAPKLQPKALATNLVAMFAGAGITPVGVTGLGDVRLVRLDGGYADTTRLQISFSADGGSSWGAWQTLRDTLSLAYTASVLAEIDMVSGAGTLRWVGYGSSAANSPAGMDVLALTVPANCNALRVRKEAGSGEFAFAVTAEGGR